MLKSQCLCGALVSHFPRVLVRSFNTVFDGNETEEATRADMDNIQAEKLRIPQKFQTRFALFTAGMVYCFVKKMRIPQKFHGGSSYAIPAQAIFRTADPQKG